MVQEYGTPSGVSDRLTTPMDVLASSITMELSCSSRALVLGHYGPEAHRYGITSGLFDAGFLDFGVFLFLFSGIRLV